MLLSHSDIDMSLLKLTSLFSCPVRSGKADVDAMGESVLLVGAIYFLNRFRYSPGFIYLLSG